MNIYVSVNIQYQYVLENILLNNEGFLEFDL